MNQQRRTREFIPRWEMPPDPVKALFWFLHWLLRILVRFAWIPVLGGAIYEFIRNELVAGIGSGIVAGVLTLLVGLIIWAGLWLVLLVFTISSRISQAISLASELEETLSSRQSRFNGYTRPENNGRIVEGTLTDLEEERRKRRPE